MIILNFFGIVFFSFALLGLFVAAIFGFGDASREQVVALVVFIFINFICLRFLVRDTKRLLSIKSGNQGQMKR